MTWNKLSD